MTWAPTAFKRYIDHSESSTGVARILTDAGEGFIKPLGNAEGPHALVREYVGTSLARLFGLTTFDFAIMDVQPNDEIPLGHNKMALPGPAFVTRSEKGSSWGGSEKELKRISNIEDLAKLIVFDTLILNPDRYPPTGLSRKPNYDNVFLVPTKAARRIRLFAIDFTHCLYVGSELSPRIANIDCVRDDHVYGFFPEFRSLVTEEALSRARGLLTGLGQNEINQVVGSVPSEWEINREIRHAIVEFLMTGINFLHDNDLFFVYLKHNQTRLL